MDDFAFVYASPLFISLKFSLISNDSTVVVADTCYQ